MADVRSTGLPSRIRFVPLTVTMGSDPAAWPWPSALSRPSALVRPNQITRTRMGGGGF